MTLTPKDILEKEWIEDRPGVNYVCPHCGHEYGNIWSFDFFGRIVFLLLVLFGPFILSFYYLSLYCPVHPSKM